jgi:hypothetical protein
VSLNTVLILNSKPCYAHSQKKRDTEINQKQKCLQRGLAVTRIQALSELHPELWNIEHPEHHLIIDKMCFNFLNINIKWHLQLLVFKM